MTEIEKPFLSKDGGTCDANELSRFRFYRRRSKDMDKERTTLESKESNSRRFQEMKSMTTSRSAPLPVTDEESEHNRFISSVECLSLDGDVDDALISINEEVEEFRRTASKINGRCMTHMGDALESSPDPRGDRLLRAIQGFVRREPKTHTLTALIWGGKGWIGQLFCFEMRKQGVVVVHALSRAEDLDAVRTELHKIKPDRAVCLVGRTNGPGCPNIDYLQTHKTENVRDNILAPMTLMVACSALGVHLTYFGSGCIFTQENGKRSGAPKSLPFDEMDMSNFWGSEYSKARACVEEFIFSEPSVANNQLTVRLRMPISAQSHPRNYLCKILKYPKLIDVPNSMTILDDWLPVICAAMKQKKVGIFHAVNPGESSPARIMQLYRDLINPDHLFEVTSELETEAPRSNNIMTVASEGKSMRTTEEAVIAFFQDEETRHQWLQYDPDRPRNS